MCRTDSSSTSLCCHSLCCYNGTLLDFSSAYSLSAVISSPGVILHHMALNDYIIIHQGFLHPLFVILFCSYSSVYVSFLPSFCLLSAHIAFSSNIWVSQLWWIKMCVQVCVWCISAVCDCVWYVFDILKQRVYCIHLMQPSCICYKSPSGSSSLPGNLTRDATRGHSVFVWVCVTLCAWGGQQMLDEDAEYETKE